MGFQYRLEKVLTIKEQEKQTVVTEYEKAKEKFQVKAMNLYNQLKQKEEFEKQRQSLLNNGIVIRDLQQNQFFLSKMEEKIEETEELVNDAREQMYLKQQILVYKNMELKKYESMKEKEKMKYIKKVKKKESSMMNEISIQQYVNYKK